MTLIWFALMLGVSGVWILWFLRRPLAENSLSLAQSNLALEQQKQAELDTDLDQHLIDTNAFSQAKTELRQTLATELAAAKTTKQTAKTYYKSLLFLLLFLLFVPLSVYQSLSQQSIFSNKIQPPAELSLEQKISRLKQHLVDKPNDFKAWRMLGLALFSADKPNKSLAAYERAYQINPKQVELLTEYASILYQQQNPEYTTSTIKLIEKALKIDPKSISALYLAGLIAADAQHFELADQLWQRALSLIAPNSPDMPILKNALNKLRLAQTTDAQANTKVTVNIEISKPILAKILPQDFVMIYAKAASGRPMPVAIQKIRFKDFSLKVVLSDVDSVMPNRTLSQLDTMIVVVRISRSGNAIRQAGDFQVQSGILRNTGDKIVNLTLQ